MTKRAKLTSVQKYQNLEKKLSNSILVKELISKYQEDTKNAVQNILNMCKTVRLFHEKLKTKELTEADLNYFCATVALDKNSSTYRKYLCIADKSDLFEQYLDRVPAAYTILYEITTLDSDQFELLIKSNQLNNLITLKDVKQITGKKSVTRMKKLKTVMSIKFDTSTVSDESLNIIEECYKYLSALNDAVVSILDTKMFRNTLIKKAA